jgi:hypothetical protein
MVNRYSQIAVPKKFNITISVETASKIPSQSVEQPESIDDRIAREMFQTKCPIVAGGAIDQDESIAKPTNGKTVTKSNVNVNGAKVLVDSPVKYFSMFTLWDGGKQNKGWRKLTPANPFTIMADTCITRCL